MTTLDLSPMGDAVRVAVTDGVLVAESAGSGSDVVLLHAGVADRRVWRPLAPHLSDEHRLIAYDRRGFGDSTTSAETYDEVADLIAVLDHFDVDRAVLVGNSMGGTLAIDATLSHPDRVSGLVVLAPGWSGGPYANFEQDVSDLMALFEAASAAESAGNIDEANRLECHIWLDGPRATEGRVGNPARELFLDMNRRALEASNAAGEAVPRPDAWDRLPEVAVPSAVIQGALDEPGSAEMGAAGAERLGARFVLLEDVAHLPSLEVPSDVAGVIGDVAKREAE